MLAPVLMQGPVPTSEMHWQGFNLGFQQNENCRQFSERHLSNAVVKFATTLLKTLRLRVAVVFANTLSVPFHVDTLIRPKLDIVNYKSLFRALTFE